MGSFHEKETEFEIFAFWDSSPQDLYTIMTYYFQKLVGVVVFVKTTTLTNFWK